MSPIERSTIENWKAFFLAQGISIPIFELATIVVLEAFGPEWHERFSRYLEERADLRALSGDVADRERAICWIRIAHMIHALQKCDGFAEWIDGMRNHEVEAAFFELGLATLMVQNGYELRFVKPTGVKGQDYDFDVRIGDQWIAVEAKTRRRGPIKDAATIRNALNKARSQLAVDRPGVIGIALASEYENQALDGHVLHVIQDAIHAFLEKTTRVSKVVVFWHHWQGQPPACRTMVHEVGKCIECRSLPSSQWIDRRFLIDDAEALALRAGRVPFPSFAPEYAGHF